jgi:hypothetical protein
MCCFGDAIVHELVFVHTLTLSKPRVGYLFCKWCGAFFGGERGLRTHQHIFHKRSYEEAKAVTTSAKRQITLVTPMYVGHHPAVHLQTALVEPGMRYSCSQAS